MTYFKCLNFCDSKSYAIAGLEYGSKWPMTTVYLADSTS